MQISAEQLLDLLHDAKNTGWQEGYKACSQSTIIEPPQEPCQDQSLDHINKPQRAVPRASQDRSGPLQPMES